MYSLCKISRISKFIKINGLNSVGNGRMEDSWMPKEKSVKDDTRRGKRGQKAKVMKDRYCGSGSKDCWGKKLEIYGQEETESWQIIFIRPRLTEDCSTIDDNDLATIFAASNLEAWICGSHPASFHHM
jgi:hypothetical protein